MIYLDTAVSLSVSKSPACFHVVTADHVRLCKVVYLDWARSFDMLIKASQADHPSQAT